MKDYSKFIQSKYGFITKYEIVGNDIHVYTAESKKGEPHKYPATKEWLATIESRLENQYKLVLKHKDEIKSNIIKEKSKPIEILAIILISILLGVGIISFLAISSIPSLVLSVIVASLTGISASILSSKIEKDFDKEMEVYETYFNNRNFIEGTVKTDKNALEYLSTKTTKNIKDNEKLKNQGVIDSVFNIDLMDKTKLKDLKKLLLRYQISVGLLTEQKFINPEIDTGKPNKPKTRSLKHNNK